MKYCVVCVCVYEIWEYIIQNRNITYLTVKVKIFCFASPLIIIFYIKYNLYNKHSKMFEKTTCDKIHTQDTKITYSTNSKD